MNFGETLMNEVFWGIIGCGDVTEIKSGPAFQKVNGSRLVAVMRRTPDLAEDYARRHCVPKWYADADELIHDPEVNAVYVATPPGSHLEYALRVCAAGKPAYVEKPMARNLDECLEMMKAFQNANLPLFIAYYRRGLPRFVRAKEIIQSGRIGTLTSICYRYTDSTHKKVSPEALPWRLRAEESGGGLFMDLGCHTLDIIDFICGPLDNVHGIAKNIASPYPVEDSVILQFCTPAGALGMGMWNFAGDFSEDRIEITGTEGRVSLSCFGNEPVRLDSSAGNASFDLPNPEHVHQPLIQTIISELLGKGKCPSTGETAIRTARIMDRALEGYYGNRVNGFWNNPQSWHGNRL